MIINQNISKLKPSATLLINEKVKELREKGEQVTHFGFGQSPFPIHNSIVEELKNKQPDKQVEFKIQPWMTAWCDPKMFRQVLYNLFSNAMDFIPQSRQGKIELSMFQRNGQNVFFVRDNGTGFSEAQAKRLFNTFRDNPQDSDLPKNTVRLASARRIVHRHGGQIWAEGIQDVAGTIYFTYH